MKINVMHDTLVKCVLNEVHVPMLFVGEMGLGKTWNAELAAETANDILKAKMNTTNDVCGFVDLRLATQEPGDLVGRPYDYVDPVTGETIMKWSRPSWFPKQGTRGILFLDELNRAGIEARQAAFQLVGEWRLHEHKLPDGWIIAAAINPDNSEYQVETLDKAMLRRFCQIRVVNDAAGWMKWARDYGINKSIIKCIKDNKDLLYKREEFEVEAFPTPEGYRMLDALLAAEIADVHNDPEDTMFEMAVGLVGKSAAAVVMKYIRTNVDSCITAEEVLEDWAAVKDDCLDQSNDRMARTVEEFVMMYDESGAPEGKKLENFKGFLKSLGSEWLMKLMISLKDNDDIIKALRTDRELKHILLDVYTKVNEK